MAKKTRTTEPAATPDSEVELPVEILPAPEPAPAPEPQFETTAALLMERRPKPGGGFEYRWSALGLRGELVHQGDPVRTAYENSERRRAEMVFQRMVQKAKG